MTDPAVAPLWVVSGGASLVFLAWALAQLVRIRRATGATATRQWFLVFLLSMIALVLAGIAGGALGWGSAVVPGACLAVAGFALHKAARVQRSALEAASHVP